MYLYWCYTRNRWDAIIAMPTPEGALEEGELWLLNTHVIAPIAVTRVDKGGSRYELLYYRDASPDLLHELMQPGWLERLKRVIECGASDCSE